MKAERPASDKNIRFLLLGFICFVLTYLDYSNSAYIKKTKSVINDGAAYVSNWIVRPFQLITEIPTVYNEFSLLQKKFENQEELKNTISKLELENNFLKKDLQKYLSIQEQEKNYSRPSIIAKVLFNSKNIYANNFLIDKGSVDGIKVGNPVIKNNNLLGQISEVNFKSSRVILLKDLNSRIPVLIGEKLYTGIMVGDLNETSGVKLEFLPKEYEFQDQDKIYTSEIESILPKGIYIGKLIKQNNNYLVEFNYNFINLDYVSVLIEQ